MNGHTNLKKMSNIDQFLAKTQHSLINDGMSGAEIYSIGDRQILKRAQKSKIKGEGLYETFIKEARFYHYAMKHHIEFVPKVDTFFETDINNEIGILMNKYHPIKISEIQSKIENIFSTLVQLHSLTPPSPDELSLPKCNIVNINSSDLKNYSEGWNSVLNEHPDITWHNLPSGTVIEKISATINEINSKFFNQKLTLIHGDFHLCNCLCDDDGNVIFCDWQNVSLGDPSSDLSFFLSRLNADGYVFTEDEIISLYLKNLPSDVNRNSKKNEILNSMHLAEMNTSFMFWHEYLHNSSKERVSRVFNKMVDCWDALNSQIKI